MADKLYSELNKGAWSSVTAYTVGDFVNHNGSSYTCIAETTNNEPPNITYWALLSSKGDQGEQGETGNTGLKGDPGIQWKSTWSGSIAYILRDVVYSGGSSYICIQANTNQEPPSALYWELIAQKGIDGEGAGDVIGPSSSINNNVVFFNGISGKLIKDSGLSLSGLNTGDETATRIGALIGGADDATPNDTDFVATSLTAAGILKKITWTNVKAFLKTYFDSLTTTFTGKTFDDELRLKQITTPADPATGYNKLYFKTDGKLYYLDENSVETEVGAGGGGILTTTSYAPSGFLINGKIVPSVTSNNLTVAIKGMDGNDPSPTNPVYVRIGDTVRTITSALSVTKNAGTNWFNSGSVDLATKEIDYFVYLGYNATDGVVIGFSRIPYGTLYSEFSTTNTDEKYCAISTITNADAGDDYEVIGRFAATLSAGAGYTWSVPTFTNINLIQRPIYETRWSSWNGVADVSFIDNGSGGQPTFQEASYQISDVNLSYKIRIVSAYKATTNNSVRFTTKPFSATSYTDNSAIGVSMYDTGVVWGMGFSNYINNPIASFSASINDNTTFAVFSTKGRYQI